MEIMTQTRTISVDSLEVLALEERLALQGNRVANDAAAQKRIKRAFRERREGLTEPEQFCFSVAPVDLVNQMQSLEFARSMGLWDGQSQDLSAYTLALVTFLMQTKEWSGFNAGGQELPCTRENKVLVFGQASLVIQAAMEKFQAEEEAERKNSKASPAG